MVNFKLIGAEYGSREGPVNELVTSMNESRVDKALKNRSTMGNFSL